MAKLLCFEPLSDLFDVESMTAPRPAEVKIVADLPVVLHQHGNRWQHDLGTDNLQFTFNEQFCDTGTLTSNNDEIAFISRTSCL